MPNTTQRAFASGELTPSLWARTDIAKYETGLRTARNGFILRQGGFTNRPGTEFDAEVKVSANPARLIPFVFSLTQAYMLELGDKYLRLHSRGAPVIATGTGGNIFSKTVFQCHFDGANGGSTFTDVLGHAMTPQANATTDTSTFQFPPSSGNIAGNMGPAEIAVAWSPNLPLPGDFTIEGWFKVSGFVTALSTSIVDHGFTASPADGSWMLSVNNVAIADGLLVFTRMGRQVISLASVCDNTWHHVAICLAGTTMSMYVDGIFQSSATAPPGALATHVDLTFGRIVVVGAALTGHVDEWRIVNGLAVYTKNFTPPIAPFPDFDTGGGGPIAAWDSTVTYQISDLASVGGVNYYAVARSINVMPPNALYWYALTGDVYEIPTPYAVADLAAIQYAQSADVMSLAHPNYPTMELKRLGNSDWTLTPAIFNPTATIPTGVSVSATADPSGNLYSYIITTIDGLTGQESLPSEATTPTAYSDPTSAPAADLHTITWNAALGAVSYNVYLSLGGSVFGLIGSSTSNSFINNGIIPNVTMLPPVAFAGLQNAKNYPSVVSYYQQRRLYANTLNEPERVWASKSGDYSNFSTQLPTLDDDSLDFVLANAEVSAVRFLLDLGKLILGSDSGEWLVEGDANGVLTPSAINARVGSYNGVNALRPIRIDFSTLYVQSLGTRVLELVANIMYGYYTFAGADLTLFSSHLFDGFTLVDWAYAQIPNYTVWAVRNDGQLLSLTYLKEQQVMAWAHSDTLGKFENVATIPEDGENRVYVIVNRTINGVTKRYVERFSSRLVTDNVFTPNFMDTALIYDGRNTGTATVTITPDGGGYTVDDLLTLTGSVVGGVHLFTGVPVGDAWQITDAAGAVITFTITRLVSADVVIGTVDKNVPVDLQNVATAVWTHAVPSVSGLDVLEGQAVAVFADGNVVASPNNPKYTEPTIVASGAITLDKPYGFIRVGLPYLTDFETLDVDRREGPSVKETRMNITKLGIFFQATRGLWFGGHTPKASLTDGLVEMKIRDENGEENWNDPVEQRTQWFEQAIESEWNSNGRVFIRQLDPLPMTILSITPMGYMPQGV